MYDECLIKAHGVRAICSWGHSGLAVYHPFSTSLKTHLAADLPEWKISLCDALLRECFEHQCQSGSGDLVKCLSRMGQIIVAHADAHQMNEEHRLLYLSVTHCRVKALNYPRDLQANWLAEMDALKYERDGRQQNRVMDSLRNLDLMGIIHFLEDMLATEGASSSRLDQIVKISSLCHLKMRQECTNAANRIPLGDCQPPIPVERKCRLPQDPLKLIQETLNGNPDVLFLISQGSWPVYLRLFQAFVWPQGQACSKEFILAYWKRVYGNKTPSKREKYLIERTVSRDPHKIYQLSLNLFPLVLSHLIALKELEIPCSGFSSLVDPEYRQNILKNLIQQASKISWPCTVSGLGLYVLRSTPNEHFFEEVHNILRRYLVLQHIDGAAMLQEYLNKLECLNKAKLEKYAADFACQLLLFNFKSCQMTSQILSLYIYFSRHYGGRADLEQPLRRFVSESFAKGNFESDQIGNTLREFVLAIPDKYIAAQMETVFQPYLQLYDSNTCQQYATRVRRITRFLKKDLISLKILKDLYHLLQEHQSRDKKKHFYEAVSDYLLKNSSRFSSEHLPLIHKIGDMLE